MADFPAERFHRAAATEQEIADLQAKFAALDPAGQQSQVDRIQAMSDYQLADLLQQARDTEPAVEDTPDTAPAAPAAPPVPTSPDTAATADTADDEQQDSKGK